MFVVQSQIMSVAAASSNLLPRSASPAMVAERAHNIVVQGIEQMSVRKRPVEKHLAVARKQVPAAPRPLMQQQEESDSDPISDDDEDFV